MKQVVFTERVLEAGCERRFTDCHRCDGNKGRTTTASYCSTQTLGSVTTQEHTAGVRPTSRQVWTTNHDVMVTTATSYSLIRLVSDASRSARFPSDVFTGVKQRHSGLPANIHHRVRTPAASMSTCRTSVSSWLIILRTLGAINGSEDEMQ